MSQIDFIELAKTVVKSRITWIVAAAVVGLLLLAWLLTSVESCRFQSKQDKLKNEVNAKLQTVEQIKAQEANLKEQKAAVIEGIKRDTAELSNSIYGLEQAKEETNKAIANYEKAVNSNSNVDRSAEDILRKLEELK